MSTSAFVCGYVRTPIGRYAGGLATVRADDLAAEPLRALVARHTKVDWGAVDDVVFGCANQAGEDNRNVARMALLLAGLPETVAGQTVNRLCGSGMQAVLDAASNIRNGDADFVIAGGVESMTRAPFVVPKVDAPFGRSLTLEDTTMGWRFINPKMQKLFGTDAMPETAENVAAEHAIARADQDAFAYRSQRRAAAAQESGKFRAEIAPVTLRSRKGDTVFAEDEHLRADTTLEKLAKLEALFAKTRANATVTAGNASGINDGAAALLIANEASAARHGLTPIARVVGGAVAGVAPRVMGLGPIPATQKLLARIGWTLASVDVIELNEAFAAQGLACLRGLGLPDDAEHVNPNGGAIALGHPLGMSGARLVGTAALELQRRGGKRAIATMCIGVGQGIAIALEAV